MLEGNVNVLDTQDSTVLHYSGRRYQSYTRPPDLFSLFFLSPLCEIQVPGLVILSEESAITVEDDENEAGRSAKRATDAT